MSPSPAGKTFAKDLATDPLFAGLLANVQMHLCHKANLKTVVEIADLRLAKLRSGCGFRWSYW